MLAIISFSPCTPLMPIPDRPIREKGVCCVRSVIGWSNLVINKLFSATVTVFSPVLALIRAPTIIRNNTSNKKNDKNTPSMEANMNLKNCFIAMLAFDVNILKLPLMNDVYLSLGSNLGKRQENLAADSRELQNMLGTPLQQD